MLTFFVIYNKINFGESIRTQPKEERELSEEKKRPFHEVAFDLIKNKGGKLNRKLLKSDIGHVQAVITTMILITYSFIPEDNREGLVDIIVNFVIKNGYQDDDVLRPAALAIESLGGKSEVKNCLTACSSRRSKKYKTLEELLSKMKG